MKAFLSTALAVLLTAALRGADAAERMKIAVMPPTGQVKQLAEVHTGEYVHDAMITGVGKIERFDVLSAGDVQRLLDENLLKAEDVKVEKAADIAKALKVRLVLFVDIRKADLEIDIEDKVLIQTQVAVCTASVGGTLYDASSGATTAIGPYEEEERQTTAKDAKTADLAAKETERMVKAALESAAKKIRSRIYKLYPLAGTITASDGKELTLDIGTKMGVAAGQKYLVYGMVEKENPITGLKEKTREEVSLLEVTGATEDSAKCKVIRGEPSPLIGSAVERDLKE
jgi:hypothetical protein